MATLVPYLLLLFPAQPQVPRMDVTAVAKANTAALQSIHSLMVRVEIWDDLPDEGSQQFRRRPELNYTYAWYRQGDEERLRELRHRPDPKGLLRSNDSYNGKRGFKDLMNFDLDNPYELSESIDGPAAGVMASRRPPQRPFRMNPRTPLLMTLGYQARTYTLQEFVEQAGKASVEKAPAESDLKCYELRVRCPDYDFRIAVDPGANFMMRRIEAQPAEPDKTPEAWLREVESFHDCGGGVYLPAKATRKLTNLKQDVSTNMVVRTTEYKVNEPLPPEIFDVKFPEWLRVTDQEKNKIYVWGVDGPRLTFNSPEEYNTWFRPRMRFTQKVKSLGWTAWAGIAVGTVLVVAVGARLFVRWRARRRVA
jgi:hypothetical protein